MHMYILLLYQFLATHMWPYYETALETDDYYNTDLRVGSGKNAVIYSIQNLSAGLYIIYLLIFKRKKLDFYLSLCEEEEDEFSKKYLTPKRIK